MDNLQVQVFGGLITKFLKIAIVRQKVENGGPKHRSASLEGFELALHFELREFDSM